MYILTVLLHSEHLSGNITISPTLVFIIGLVLLFVGAIMVMAGTAKLDSYKKLVCDEHFGEKEQKETVVEIYSYSNIGDRTVQQDYCLCTDGLIPRPSALKKLGVLCDGIGGLEAGEVASRLCAEVILSRYCQFGYKTESSKLLEKLILDADREVSRVSATDGRHICCGTTVVAAIIGEREIHWASAGDSRIYLFHGDDIKRLTRDHNFRPSICERYNPGHIAEERIDSNPQKNALISFVGKGNSILIDTGTTDFFPQEGDILLMCSDGLYRALSDEQIAQHVRFLKDKSSIPQSLVNLALSNKQIKHDNISVMIFA